MNILKLKTEKEIRYEEVEGDLQIAVETARKYLTNGWKVELFRKHSDLSIGGVEISKTAEQAKLDQDAAELAELKKNPEKGIGDEAK